MHIHSPTKSSFLSSNELDVNVFTILCDIFNSELYLTSVLINYSVLVLINAFIHDINRWSRITSGPAPTSY